VCEESISKTANSNNIAKFMLMDSGRRSRIINAAMSEFRHGYKKATTDDIVKRAGISKGLLFHYFGTKERLYAFLVNYAIDVINSEYISMMNFEQSDLLEVLWQMALLKRDISLRYPSLYDFLKSAHVHMSEIPNEEVHGLIVQKREYALDEFYKRCDISLFAEDIDPKKAIDLIW